jgi:hypothetical protein
MAKLKDIVRFRGDRLFNGAVSIDWFWTDESKRKVATEAFVFHGPTYHGVTQTDVGVSHGYRLIDTANFTRNVVHRCLGLQEEPFTLAIAGYGTGKSHLALTLASLLSDPASSEAEQVLLGLEAADERIGGEIRSLLKEELRPFLVVAINGVHNFDLTAELTHQIISQARSRNLNTRPLDELRPRFRQAASLIRMSSDAVVAELVAASGMADIGTILNSIEKQEENVYKQVHEFFASRGMPISALGGESVKDVIEVTIREYCGEGKPFTGLVILFDEFGRYTEFATVRSQVAGSGVLQDMFEGVQANADSVTFIGFIQFELNAYVQRVAPEFKNEILRYITRYQSANKAYLSINLETLLAHLIEKRNPTKLNAWFDHEDALKESENIVKYLHSWFPDSRNHRLWNDSKQFHAIIRKGCWPLSPLSSWLLFYLTAAGKYLQERSAFSLLGDVFDRVSETEVLDDGSWVLAPVDLWSNALQEELISSEESGQQGSITHAYSSVIARYGNQFSEDLVRLLRGIVLSSKLGLQVPTKDNAIVALAKLSGLPLLEAKDGIANLQDEYNVIEWDPSFKQFDILGDAVPRTQFIAFVRQRVASSFDENTKARLFASKAKAWCDLFGDLDCDFAEEHGITTREWRYEAVTSNLELLETNLKFAANRWNDAVAVDEARGTVVYCYVEQSRNPDEPASQAKRFLRGIAREIGVPALPIFVVFLGDEDGLLGQTLAELAVLKESLTEEDRARFGNLIGAHIEKAQQIMRTKIEGMIRSRRYVTILNEDIDAQRLSRFGSELFARIYKKPVPFPFDGFSVAKGNAADTCQQMITELLQANLDYDTVIAKPAKVKNRSIAVLQGSWGVFTKTGAISRRPSHPVVRNITEIWDNTLESEEGRPLVIGKILREVCLPPYGANIASAGLLFGIYVAPRMEKFMVVHHGQQYSIKQWLQNGIFRGKFLDLPALENDELVLIGKESLEWEILLDEWEQAESYYERGEFLNRAHGLKMRVPVPPMLFYRFEHLENQAKEAIIAIEKVDKEQNDALIKMERGYQQSDVSMLSWGTASLFDMKKDMIVHQPLWTDYQINEIQPHIERGRQAIIQIFARWLAHQGPQSSSPDKVGDFKHKMLRLVGGNLKKIELIELYEQLESQVNFLISNVETTAEARQLIRDVSSWVDQHIDACRIIRIAEVRGFREIGKNYSSKLQGMARRIEMPEINDVRQRLADFLSKLKDSENSIMKRAFSLRESRISSMEDIETLMVQVDAIMGAFEGVDEDLEDFRLMRRGLQTYQQTYTSLQDERLTWPEFDLLSETLRKEAEKIFGDEELPWPPDETISGFIEIIRKNRQQASLSWIRQIESETEAIATMTAVEANQLYRKSSNPPQMLSEKHTDRLSRVINRIEHRLEFLKIDWLLEKFKELPPPARKKFIKIASDLSEIK